MPSTSTPQLLNTYDEPSDSNPGLAYTVSEWANGALTCDCPSFIRGRQQRGKDLFERTCKHTDRVRARLKAGAPVPVVPTAPADPFALLEKTFNRGPSP